MSQTGIKLRKSIKRKTLVLVTRTGTIALDIVRDKVLVAETDIVLVVNIDTVLVVSTDTVLVASIDIIRAVIRATVLAASTDITLVTALTTLLADTVLAGRVIKKKRKSARNGVRRKRLSLEFYSSCFV